MKLRISLKQEEVGFVDNYATSQGIKSRSAVIRQALRLLRAKQLSANYTAVFNELEGDAGMTRPTRRPVRCNRSGPGGSRVVGWRLSTFRQLRVKGFIADPVAGLGSAVERPFPVFA